MDRWGQALYGDPCRQCDFRWSMATDEAVDYVTKVHRTFEATLLGASGSERHPALEWTVTAYVCHVGDNLSIWAERLAGVTRGADPRVAAYDENLLAQARRYETIALPAALWSLERAGATWCAAVALASESAVTLVHPDRGELDLGDVVRANAHDAIHHHWDVVRSLEAAASG